MQRPGIEDLAAGGGRVAWRERDPAGDGYRLMLMSLDSRRIASVAELPSDAGDTVLTEKLLAWSQAVPNSDEATIHVRTIEGATELGGEIKIAAAGFGGMRGTPILLAADGDRIAWSEESDDGSGSVWTWQVGDAKPTNISAIVGVRFDQEELLPVVSDGLVVWRDERRVAVWSQTNRDVFGLDPGFDGGPLDAESSRIAWQQSRADKSELVVRDLVTGGVVHVPMHAAAATTSGGLIDLGGSLVAYRAEAPDGVNVVGPMSDQKLRQGVSRTPSGFRSTSRRWLLGIGALCVLAIGLGVLWFARSRKRAGREAV